MSFQLPAPLPSSGGEFPFGQFGGPGPGGRNYLHFTIRHANWLAHAFQSSHFTPNPQEYRELLDVLHQYLSRLEDVRPEPLRRMAKESLEDLYIYGDDYGEISLRLRHRFRAAPWRALILPGGIARGPSSSATSLKRIALNALKHELEFLESKRQERKDLEGAQTAGGAEEKPYLERGPSLDDAFDQLKELAKTASDRGDPAEPKDPAGSLDIKFARALSGSMVHPLGGEFDYVERHINVAEKKFEQNLQIGRADEFFTSERLFRDLYDSESAPPYLAFQLGMPAGDLLYLEDIFPAFTLAFAEATRWPGVIVWNLRGERAFFPLPTSDESAQRATRLIFSSIEAAPAAPVEQLKQAYMAEVFQAEAVGARPLNIIHTSDMHLGDKVADSRLITVKDRIGGLVNEMDPGSMVVPVVTGDLMDTPSERHLDSMRDYLHFLDGLGAERPVVVPGNHDVRKMGIFSKRYEEALRLYLRPVVWLDQSKVGLLCFNSVRAGRLARGYIDEKEFAALGHELDVEPRRSKDYALLALVHHHPCPVKRPDWYAKVWYERWLGGLFEETEELENAPLFLEWLLRRRVLAVLHGHKHIPRVTNISDINIIGCGSTVGKVQPDKEGRTFMSTNLMTVNVDAGRLSCRLRVERIVGSGLQEIEAHEILFRDAVVLAA